MNKLLSYLTPVLLVAILVLQIISFGGTGVAVGGTTNYDQIDTTDGYSVDGTSVINGSGVWIGTITTSNAGTFSGGLTASGGFTTDRILFGSTGKTTNSTATSTLTLTAANVCDNALYEWTPSVASATTSLPTATTLVADCLTADGMYKYFRLKNLGDTASTTYISGLLSNGLNLRFASSSNATASSTIAGGAWVDLYFQRASSTQVDVGATVFDKNIQ